MRSLRGPILAALTLAASLLLSPAWAQGAANLPAAPPATVPTSGKATDASAEAASAAREAAVAAKEAAEAARDAVQKLEAVLAAQAPKAEPEPEPEPKKEGEKDAKDDANKGAFAYQLGLGLIAVSGNANAVTGNVSGGAEGDVGRTGR